MPTRSENLELIIKAKNLTNDELKKLRNEYKKTGASAKEANKILKARDLLGVESYRAIQRDIKQLGAAYNRLKKDGKTSAADLYQAKLKLQQKTADLRKETGDWAGELGKAKIGIAGLAAAGYAFVKSFQQYSEFSQRMGEVNTLIDVSQKRFAALGKEIRGLTKEIPQTSSELAAAEYDIISAGVDLEKSVGVLKKSAKAAVAGVTDTKTAANAGIAVINAYGKSIDDLDEVYDVLFKTVKLGVTTFPQLAQSIGEVLPTAKAADVGIRAISASIAALTKAGIRTPQAMTSLKGAINALAAPAPEAKKQFDALGITWQGLIPTLDAIRKKSLSIKQLRLLIPDVEARTGVLALTQNFDSLVEILGEMQNASGAMEDAYDKMKDTPENQIKLFRNEINELTISAGALVSKGLLPLAKTVRMVINSIDDIDPVTKGLVTTLTAAIVGFTIWRTSLKFIISGLGGFAVKAQAAQLAAGSFNAQLTASGIAMKASLVASIAYTIVQLGRLGVEFYKVRKAMKEEEEAQSRLIDNTDRMMRKYAEFRNVRLPGDLTKLARSDLEELRKKLAKARVFYTALKVQAEELGNTKALAKINARLKEINEDLKKVGDAAAGAAEEMKKPAKSVEATEKQLKEFEKQAKKAYEEAKKQAADYANKVIEFEEKIKYARLSTEDKIRELRRKGLSEEKVFNDKRLQADEKLYAAKRALAQKDFKLAETLAKDAEGLYADLATEVKGTKAGKDVVIKSLEETKKIAIDGITEVGKFVKNLYTEQKDAARTAHYEWQATADGIKKHLDEIAKKREANIDITLSGLKEAQDAINRFIRTPAIKKIKVVTEQAKRSGGSIFAQSGRKIPGYGGGDKIRAIVEAGEFVVRKEAVQKYGAGLFEALNAMKLNMAESIKARIGGMISNISIPAPRIAYQTGGIVQGSGETMTIRFQAGDVDMPLTVLGNRRMTRVMIKEFENELIKLGMAKRQ